MQPQERQLALNQLQSSETHILALVKNLTPAQWNFHEGPNRWSIAENIEHLAIFEPFIIGAITKALQTPTDPDKNRSTSEKEPDVLAIADSRNAKLTAREAVRPTGRWPNPSEAIAEFRKARAHTIAFATETQAELRNHFFPHISLDDLDCYQWLVVLGQHTLRHTAQIEEVKADPNYPAT
jgi:DinB superfamily